MESIRARARVSVCRWKDVSKRIAAIPFVFFGVGIYRAWLSIFFRFDAFPTVGPFDYFMFEGAIGVISLVLAFAATRITPLWSNGRARALTALFMSGGSALVIVSCFIWPLAALKVAGLVLAGCGLGSLILMWAEFYGMLNPMRVAVYHAAAIFLGEILKWLFTGLDATYIVVFSVGLPLLSLDWVIRSMKRLPSFDQPRRMESLPTASFPWKPIVLMEVCTFATGFGALPDQPLLAGNLVGTMLVTAFVFFGALSSSKWFNFDTIYRLAFPLITIGFLFIVPMLPSNPQGAAACYDAGYTMLSMFIMIVLSNITYRFGISAVWLNGIERGIRYLIEPLGWGVYALVSATESAHTLNVVHIAIMMAVAAVVIALIGPERRLSAKWGINLKEEAPGDDLFSPGHLAMRVAELSRERNLSPREEEVLQLLARKESTAQIEA
ncbi:MAG: LuxR family transcriptional regulator, partial [Slackia sp.]|nr:LuxR family transcriptional regulator [Slackia sp.]